jgi:hypothetical protein
MVTFVTVDCCFFLRSVFSYEPLYTSLHDLIWDYPWSDFSEEHSVP